MGNTFTVVSDRWTLKFQVQDDGLQVSLTIDGPSPATHPAKLKIEEAEALRDYLYRSLPIST
jgi:hypothetical protein